MNCSNCGAPLEENARFCGNCGAVVTNHDNNRSVCPNCGAEVNAGEQFCGRCGTRLTYYTPPAADPVGINNMNNINTFNKVNNKVKKTGSGTEKDNTKLIVIIIAAAVFLVALIAAFIIMVQSGILGGASNNETNGAGSAQNTETAAQTPVPTAAPTPTPTPIPAPVFTGVTASSTRGTDYTSGSAVEYYPSYAVDGNYSTAWSANRNISLNPYITLTADTPQYVHGIRVSNGYFKNQTTYTRNRRITQFSIEYEGGQKTYYCGIDQYRIMQDIKFDAPVWTSYITVRVMDTYYGDWKDIAISEIEVY